MAMHNARRSSITDTDGRGDWNECGNKADLAAKSRECRHDVNVRRSKRKGGKLEGGRNEPNEALQVSRLMTQRREM
jgi:hypothetical protein